MKDEKSVQEKWTPDLRYSENKMNVHSPIPLLSFEIVWRKIICEIRVIHASKVCTKPLTLEE